MSTSPSWFDQDKFSRLVKGGAQKATGQPAARQPVPETKVSSEPIVKEASLPAEEKPGPFAYETKAPSEPIVKEAPLPTGEMPGQPAHKAPPQPPGEAPGLSQRLPRIELTRPLGEEKLIPAPIRADAGPLSAQEIAEEAPPPPAASSAPKVLPSG